MTSRFRIGDENEMRDPGGGAVSNRHERGGERRG